MKNRPVILCILDGFGVGPGTTDDAIHSARTPHLDRLSDCVPYRTLVAHGTAVGLPSDGDMGNSEVGHNAMGAGRVFDQGAKLVNRALDSGTAFESTVWAELIAGKTLHLLGLLSDGNVHSHVAHLHKILDRCEGLVVRIHVLTDGRDVEARSALRWIEPLEERLATARQAGQDWWIASGGGRMFMTMDRYEADWAMVERGWDVHVRGRGRRFPSASTAVRSLYTEDPGVDDQYLPGFVVEQQGEPVGRIKDGDSVLLFNFRGDRAIEISRAFAEPGFSAFPIEDRPQVFYAGMMQYDGDRNIPERFLVAPPAIDSVVGEHLAAAGKRSFVCSETQKFGHVTFFFNGNRSGLLDPDRERYQEIPSDRETPDTRPWMKAAEIIDATIAALEEGFDHLRLNLANCDMVGHTGVLEAARIAAEAVDLQVGRLVEAAADHQAILLITADHGNADEMYQRKKGVVKTREDGSPLPRTSHTLNPVPLWVVDPLHQATLTEVPRASIANLGATVLALCGVAVPDSYLPTLVKL